MPYGPQPDNPSRVAVGTLELLGQKAVVHRRNELDLADDKIASQSVWRPSDDTELEDAVDAVRNARIVVMNPPFTSRKKMGEKFSQAIKTQLQRRTDTMEAHLTNADEEMTDFTDKNSLRPLFVALADHCVETDSSIITMINPTIALAVSSGRTERRVLAKRFHIHTVLTSHRPGQINLSQNTGINESIILARRHQDPKPPHKIHQPRSDANQRKRSRRAARSLVLVSRRRHRRRMGRGIVLARRADGRR